jgi:hypothetical protein
MGGEVPEEFESRIQSLQDASVLDVLRGVSDAFVQDVKGIYDGMSGASGAGGAGGAGGARRRLPALRRRNRAENGSKLLIPFLSILDRASHVSVAHHGSSLLRYMADFLSKNVWVIDEVLAGLRRPEARGQKVVGLVFDAIALQGDSDAAASYMCVLKCIRRNPELFNGSELVVIIVERSLDALRKVSGVSMLERAWVPWAFGLAFLPFIESKIKMNEHYDDGKLWYLLEESCKVMVETPEVLVESVSNNIDSKASIETVMALLEINMQIWIGKCLENYDGSAPEKSLEMCTVFRLLTVRWELEWVAKALGLAHFQSYFTWDSKIRDFMLLQLMESRNNALSDVGGLVRLSCTPPQALVALELLRASKSSKHNIGTMYAGYIGRLLFVAMEGLFKPKEVVTAQRTQEFASLAQRIRSSFSKCAKLESMLTKPRSGEIIHQEDVVDKDGVERDSDVVELLTMIGCAGTNADRVDSPDTKHRKRVTPEKIGVKVEDAVANKDGAPQTHIHHKGRVIMPPTYDLDGESRELLWKEYIKDKDKLVEMLGDSGYRQWHDESSRPAARPHDGVDRAFDAIFGTGSAIDEYEGTILDRNGCFIDMGEKTTLELSMDAPWDALLAGVLAVVMDVARQLGAKKLDHEPIFAALLGSSNVSDVSDVINEALRFDDVDTPHKESSETTTLSQLDGLTYFSATMKKVLLHMARHARPEVLRQFLDLIHSLAALNTVESGGRNSNTRARSLAQGIIRSCMSFPPLMGSSINPKSAKLIPEVCGLCQDIEAILYTSACCWTVWHSLKSKRVPATWIPESYDLSTHPLCASGVHQRCHFITSSLRHLSSMVNDINESSEDIMAALIASSSLCATIAVDLRKGMTLYRTRKKTTKSAFQIICEQKIIHLNLFSITAALCEIYCGLAEDWDEFLSEPLQEDEDIPHAGAVVFGFDFSEAILSYMVVLREEPESALCTALSMQVLDSIYPMIAETRRRLDRVLQRIQRMDKTSTVYKISAREIASAPAIIVLDAATHYRDAASADHDSQPKADRKRKTMKDVSNPYVKAMLHETGRSEDDFLLEDDLSDLEDWIVANPDTDYVEFLRDHFPQRESDDEEGLW